MSPIQKARMEVLLERLEDGGQISTKGAETVITWPDEECAHAFHDLLFEIVAEGGVR